MFKVTESPELAMDPKARVTTAVSRMQKFPPAANSSE